MPRPVELNHLSPNFIWLSLHGHYLIQIIFLVAKIQLAYKSSIMHVKEWERIQAFFINRNIGVLSGRLLLLEGVNKTFIVWVELSLLTIND